MDPASAMISITYPAPAKINWFLHITGRLDNGYHQLQTVFQFLTLSDHLTFKFTDDANQLNIEQNATDNIEDNLIYKAAQLLLPYRAIQAGCDIRCDKRIPIGGGLGGGSSNAATTLLALNKHWNCGLSTDELAAMGLKLGADVPVFIHGHSAWAEGIGEQLTPVTLLEKHYIVVFPKIHVSTVQIFNDKDLTRDTKPLKICTPEFKAVRNDCEPVVFRHYPKVKQAFQWLSQFADARMTGTGACIFAPVDCQAKAEFIANVAPDDYEVFITQGKNRSPLLDRIMA